MQIKNSKSFGIAVRVYRNFQCLTQAQLAAMTNTSPRFISSLESGNPNVQLDKALRVAWMLGYEFAIKDKEDKEWIQADIERIIAKVSKKDK